MLNSRWGKVVLTLFIVFSTLYLLRRSYVPSQDVSRELTPQLHTPRYQESPQKLPRKPDAGRDPALTRVTW